MIARLATVLLRRGSNFSWEPMNCEGAYFIVLVLSVFRADAVAEWMRMHFACCALCVAAYVLDKGPADATLGALSLLLFGGLVPARMYRALHPSGPKRSVPTRSTGTSCPAYARCRSGAAHHSAAQLTPGWKPHCGATLLTVKVHDAHLHQLRSGLEGAVTALQTAVAAAASDLAAAVRVVEGCVQVCVRLSTPDGSPPSAASLDAVSAAVLGALRSLLPGVLEPPLKGGPQTQGPHLKGAVEVHSPLRPSLRWVDGEAVEPPPPLPALAAEAWSVELLATESGAAARIVLAGLPAVAAPSSYRLVVMPEAAASDAVSVPFELRPGCSVASAEAPQLPGGTHPAMLTNHCGQVLGERIMVVGPPQVLRELQGLRMALSPHSWTAFLTDLHLYNTLATAAHPDALLPEELSHTAALEQLQTHLLRLLVTLRLSAAAAWIRGMANVGPTHFAIGMARGAMTVLAATIVRLLMLPGAFTHVGARSVTRGVTVLVLLLCMALIQLKVAARVQLRWLPYMSAATALTAALSVAQLAVSAHDLAFVGIWGLPCVFSGIPAVAILLMSAAALMALSAAHYHECLEGSRLRGGAPGGSMLWRPWVWGVAALGAGEVLLMAVHTLSAAGAEVSARSLLTAAWGPILGLSLAAGLTWLTSAGSHTRPGLKGLSSSTWWPAKKGT